MWGVSIAAEKKMRQEAADLIGDDIKAEMVPFSFTHKDGGDLVKPAPMAYIPDIWQKVQDLLDQNSDHNKGYLHEHTSTHILDYNSI